MKNYILLFLLSFVFIRVSAQELSQEISLPRAGDILDKTQLDYTTSGASGGYGIFVNRQYVMIITK